MASVHDPSPLHGILQQERAPVLVQLASHKVRSHARAAGGARLAAQPLLLPLERAAWHHTLVLRAADLRPDHHLSRRNDEGTRAGQGREGVRERESARPRCEGELCFREVAPRHAHALRLTLGLVPPAKPAFVDALPQSITMG